jgi:hypothetical protein
MELEFGVSTRARISEFYGMDLIKTIVDRADGLNRWGFDTNKGALISKIYETKVVPKILKRFLDDELSSTQAAQIMDEQINTLE